MQWKKRRRRLVGRSALSVLHDQLAVTGGICTGIAALDQLLWAEGTGARQGDGVYELCGLPGGGKTQIAMQWCVHAQIEGIRRRALRIQPKAPPLTVGKDMQKPGKADGLDLQQSQGKGEEEKKDENDHVESARPATPQWKCFYIDSEGSFFGERYLEIAARVLEDELQQELVRRAHGVDHQAANGESSSSEVYYKQLSYLTAEQLLNDLVLVRVFDHYEFQQVLLSYILPWALPQNSETPTVAGREEQSYISQKRIRAVHPPMRGFLVIDSLAALYRDTTKQSARTSQVSDLNCLHSCLTRMADVMNVVTTNTVTHRQTPRSEWEVVPSLGSVWLNVPSTRIVVNAEETFTVTRSRTGRVGEGKFSIGPTCK